MGFDQPGERARERPRPALGHAPAPALTAMDQRICKPSRHRPFRRDHRLERHPQHERAAMIVLEIVADDVPARHRNAAQPLLAVGMFGEPLVDRLAPADRRVGDGVEDRLDRVVVGDHAPVRGGILPGELGELARTCARCRGTASDRCRPGTEGAPRSRDECIPVRSLRARARRCAASGYPGSRHGPFRTSRAGSQEASAPPSRNCRPRPTCPPAPDSDSPPWRDRRRRSGCCARHPRRRHRTDQACPFPPFNRNPAISPDVGAPSQRSR